MDSKTLEMEPGNPRVYYVCGRSEMYAPFWERKGGRGEIFRFFTEAGRFQFKMWLLVVLGKKPRAPRKMVKMPPSHPTADVGFVSWRNVEGRFTWAAWVGKVRVMSSRDARP